MTVQELIDILERAPDNTLPVAIYYDSAPRGSVDVAYVGSVGGTRAVILVDEADKDNLRRSMPEAAKVV